MVCKERLHCANVAHGLMKRSGEESSVGSAGLAFLPVVVSGAALKEKKSQRKSRESAGKAMMMMTTKKKKRKISSPHSGYLFCGKDGRLRLLLLFLPVQSLGALVRAEAPPIAPVSSVSRGKEENKEGE